MSADYDEVKDLLSEVDMDWSPEEGQENPIGEQRLILDLATVLREVIGDMQAYREQFRRLQVEHMRVLEDAYEDALWRDEITSLMRKIRDDIATRGVTAPSKTLRRIDILLAAVITASEALPAPTDPTKD